MGLWSIIEGVTEHLSPTTIIKTIGHLSEGELGEAAKTLTTGAAVKEVKKRILDGDESDSPAED